MFGVEVSFEVRVLIMVRVVFRFGVIVSVGLKGWDCGWVWGKG